MSKKCCNFAPKLSIMRKSVLILALLHVALLSAQKHVSFPVPERWTASELSQYVGQTITFDQPVYICNNYYSNPSISLHRVMSPTNQELPGSAAYNTLMTNNNNATVTLNGLNGYHRMGEIFGGLTVHVNSTSSVTYVSHESLIGIRNDLLEVPSVDMRDKHNLLVCALNCEYYLVENLGTGYGPDNATESARQHAKIMDAIARIRADIYGFIEVEQGQAALRKLAENLTTATGRHYTWINDGGSASSSYVKTGYVYCSDVVRPHGELKNNNSGVVNRKKMQAFELIANGERFIFSINHFKAKSGSGTGADADQGDGQGIFNYTRTIEAESVLNNYNTNKNYYADDDILIMGDLNAYAKEDPIMKLTVAGMTDLHRFFHADSSYSYTFRGQAGYLDHALCNETLLPQVTGMVAYHINSDESDNYTYDKSNDVTMFRCSDHDPILVGLKLGADIIEERIPDASAEHMTIGISNGSPVIKYASGGYYTIHTLSGMLISQGDIPNADFTLYNYISPGIYIISVYVENTAIRKKVLIL